MVLTDFKCEECGNIVNVSKEKIFYDFPESIECNKCKGKCIRIWGKVDWDIAQGSLGNSDNRYTSGMTYHPSKFGKFKGIQIKKIK